MIPGLESIDHVTLLSGPQKIIQALSIKDQPESTSSSYWDEETKNVIVTKDGQIVGDSVLGTVAPNDNPLRNAFHKVMQAPFLILGHNFKSLYKIYKLGQLISKKHSRILTLDILRQILSLELISHYVDFSNSEARNVVIGDGYGVMGSLLLQHAPNRQTVMVNLTKSLLVDLISITKTFPDIKIALVQNHQDLISALANPKIRVIAIAADDMDLLNDVPMGLVINIVSMQEMDPPVVEKYFDIIRKNPFPDTYFYCCNRRYKKLSDGTETRFDDYPWSRDDDILSDRICLWNQWFYSKTPPFWHYRFGKERVIWHRLARMAKVN